MSLVVIHTSHDSYDKEYLIQNDWKFNGNLVELKKVQLVFDNAVI